MEMPNVYPLPFLAEEIDPANVPTLSTESIDFMANQEWEGTDS
jgi:hypothetical protein